MKKVCSGRISDLLVTKRAGSPHYKIQCWSPSGLEARTTKYNAIEAGAVAVVEPRVKPWGQTVAYVRDLNGVLIEICSPI